MKQKLQSIYKLAYEYLLDMLPDELTEKDLQKYFIGDRRDFNSLQDVFEQLICSAHNTQGMPNSIKYDKRRNKIKEILKDFDICEISKMDISELYYTFRDAFNVTSNDSKRNYWYKWSNSIIDSAKFLSKFKDLDDFKSFIAQFEYSAYTREALPLLISTKIKGIGFALACDTLKELGYLDYPKPDTHIIDVFYQLGLSDNEEQTAAFEAVVYMSDVCKEIDKSATPYKIDKVIWLICSGNFYLDGCSVKTRKKQFIEYIKSVIE